MRPLISPVPPARLLITAVRTASLRSVAPDEAAGVDQPRPAHVAVDHLVAGQVDGVVARQLLVDPGVGVAEIQSGVTPVQGGLLLFDDVRLDGHPQVIGLAGQVRGGMEILASALLKAGFLR